jgi:MFS transporter, putative metabolite:H+ symporter
MDEKTILYQFDHAKLGKFHLALILLSGACWALVAYGVTIIGFLLPSLRQEWQVSSGLLGVVAGAGLLGMFIGSIIGGTLADRVGRRRTLVWALFISGVFFLISSAAWNYSAFLVLRLLTGMGLGAIIPVISTLITEFSPSKVRGTLSVLINGCWGLGGTIAALVGYKVVLVYGWRLSMLFGCMAFLLCVLVRIMLPESMRYLIAKGRFEEAQRQFAGIKLNYSDNPSPVNTPQTAPVEQKISTGGIWSASFVRITSSLWFMWIALNFLYQGVLVWMPTLLASTHISEGRSFLLTMLISLGQIPGTLIVAFLVDRTRRGKLLIISLILLTLATLLLGVSQNDIWILTTGFLLMIFNGMTWGMAYSVSSELYPTRMRGAATGWAAGVGRLGGVPAPIVVGLIMQQGGSLSLVFDLLAIAPFLAIIVISTLKMDTTGKSLEVISPG